ncbi:SRPBCC family protein [Kitasatospora sp. NBC_00085]|uniref:SRPBCC family protein n=1 Tax=unclassified Kitasatospora TaxID=2633591 RepID=UPI0032437F5E
MTRIEESVEVEIPPAAAYEQWTRLEEFPAFMRGIVSIERRGPGLSHWVVDVAGVRREFDACTTEAVPDERLAWATLAGGVRQSGVVTFHRVGEHTTRVMLQLDVEPDGLVERIGHALGFADRQVIDDLGDFKTFVERDPGECDPGGLGPR